MLFSYKIIRYSFPIDPYLIRNYTKVEVSMQTKTVIILKHISIAVQIWQWETEWEKNQMELLHRQLQKAIKLIAKKQLPNTINQTVN